VGQTKSRVEVLPLKTGLFSKRIAEYELIKLLQMPTMKSSCFRMVEESDEDLLPFIQKLPS
jgi:hypothetical protein